MAEPRKRSRPLYRPDGPHGYGRYSDGCRCEVCCEAKRTYMRARRQKAAARRELAAAGGGYHFVPNITHGRSGYNEFSCRCPVCRDAKNGSDRRRVRRAS